MRDRRHVFDQLDIQAGGLQGGDRAFAPRPGAFDTDFDVTHAELAGLLGCLLGGTLAGKGRTLAAAFEPAGSGAGPAQRVAFAIGNRHRRVVKRGMHMRDATGDVSSNSFFLVGLCHGKVSVQMSGCESGRRFARLRKAT